MVAQLCGQTIGDLIPVDDMHQRKAEMARLADAFIALPGMYFLTSPEFLILLPYQQLQSGCSDNLPQFGEIGHSTQVPAL
ncbi:unnamed protein product [Sphagnum balticum]